MLTLLVYTQASNSLEKEDSVVNCSLRVLAIAGLILVLASCVQAPPITSSAYSRAPNVAYVTVTIDPESCTMVSQTAAQTCPFFGDVDPPNLVCQEPSGNEARRKIIWAEATGQKFTLEFKNGNPFRSTQGQCKIDSENDQFTCLIRRPTENPPLQPDYKYDIVLKDGTVEKCRWDPRVYLMR